MKRILSSLGMVLAAVAAMAQVDPNRVVATVNGDEIRGSEYYRRMEFMPGVGRMFGNTFATFPPGFLTIEALITQRLVLQVAKEKGISPTDAEVNQELQNTLEENPKALDNFIEVGGTKEEFLQDLKYEIAQFKIITQGVNVTDQEVDNFYANNPTMFTSPEQVKLRVIVVGDQTEQTAVDADLGSGKSFADVAKARSKDVTGNEGGDFGTMPISGIPKAIGDVIRNTKVGETTSWLTFNNAKAKFLVENKIGEQKSQLTPIVRRHLRKKLMMDKGNVKNDIFKILNDARNKANIDIKQKEFADLYKKFIDTFYRNQLAPAGTGGTGGTGGGG